MKLFIGLGNPGTRYQNTRHNLGTMVIENILKKHKTSLKNQSKLSADTGQIGQNVFAISHDFMNNSGFAVQKVASYYKIEPSDIYIIHDDLDIEVGDYKFQFDRGSAGHNGVKSTIEQLGTQAFNRIRIGVGKPTEQIPIENYVLLNFLPEEKAIILKTIDKVIADIENLL